MKNNWKIIFFGLFIFSIIGSSFNYFNDFPEKEWKKYDEILKNIKEPVFKNNIINITKVGGKGDGKTDNTKIINEAIQKLNKKGGGTLLFPAGKYLSGPIKLLSNVNLKLEDDCVILFSTNPNDYLPMVLTRWEGVDCYNYSPLIYAYGQENIAITGKGKLDGQASRENWWQWKGVNPSGEKLAGRQLLLQYNKEQVPIEQRKMGEGHYLRPQFINFYKCKNILIEGITIENSPFWIIHPLMSENIIVRNVHINSLGPNNDGCDPESCKNVLIENCYFNTGDDCIAIKSGRNEDGRKWNIPSENIIIRNCIMKNGHGGAVIGSEISGGCRYVFVENCLMSSPELDRAIRIKTNSLRGGIIENIFVKNIKVGEVSESILHIFCLYDKKEGEGNFYPTVRNVYLENVNAEKAKYGLYIFGNEAQNNVYSIFVYNSIFKNVKEKFLIKDANEVWLKNVQINNDKIENLDVTK